MAELNDKLRKLGLNPAKVVIDDADHLIKPYRLKPEYVLRAHPRAARLIEGDYGVVILSIDLGELGGYPAGTHDGIRDGAWGGCGPRRWVKVYVRPSDWPGELPN